MDNNLYFLPLLLDALDTSDPVASLAEAFGIIRRLGIVPGHEKGLVQFDRFMAEVAQCAAGSPSPSNDSAVVEEFLLWLAAGDVPEGDRTLLLLDSGLLQQPAWRELYAHVLADVQAEAARPDTLELVVTRDHVVVCTVPLPGVGESIHLKPITPGSYAFGLSTGRLLWKGDIGREDTEWKQAFPEKPLRLAADTEALSGESTKTISLLGGTLVARVYPGLEAGVLAFTLEGNTP